MSPAQWTVPTVNTATDGYSSVWVGIDGAGSSGVEQIGTGSNVINGQAVYHAWYEMYPSNIVYITNMTISAGDSMTGSVAYVSTSNNFVLSMVDNTTGQSFSITLAAPNNPTDLTTVAGSRSSAEWVVEDPTGNSLDPLANYGTVTFTNAYATIDGTTAQIDNWPSSQLITYTTSWSWADKTLSKTLTFKSLPSGLTDSVATSALPTGSTNTYSGTVSGFTVYYTTLVYSNGTFTNNNFANNTTTNDTDDTDDAQTNGPMISATPTRQPDHGWRFGLATNRHRQNPPAAPQPHHAQLAAAAAQTAQEPLFSLPGSLILLPPGS